MNAIFAGLDVYSKLTSYELQDSTGSWLTGRFSPLPRDSRSSLPTTSYLDPPRSDSRRETPPSSLLAFSRLSASNPSSSMLTK